MNSAPSMSRWIEITQVDAFTSTIFGGNPAAVVIEGADLLSKSQMQAIAREMNLSETSFLCKPRRDGADVRIRWFTPVMEVDICGHATVAAFHVAAEEGRWEFGGEGTRKVIMECRSGLLPVEVVRKNGNTLVRMGLPEPAERIWNEPGEAAVAMGIDVDLLDMELPAIVSGSYGLLPFKGMDALNAARPVMAEVCRITHELDGPDGLILATLETVDPASAAHIRMFAPLAGIDEDPMTGSAQGPVAAWMARLGYFADQQVHPGVPISGATAPVRDRKRRFSVLSGNRLAYTAEQGDIMGRPGRVRVELSIAGNEDAPRARDVSILGSCVTVMKGRIRIA